MDPVALLESAVEAGEGGVELPETVQQWLGEGLALYAQGRGLGEGDGPGG